MYFKAQLRTDNVSSYIPRKYRNIIISVKKLELGDSRKTINIKIPDTYKTVSKGIIDHEETIRERNQSGNHLGINRTIFVIETDEIDMLEKYDVLVIDKNNQIIIL